MDPVREEKTRYVNKMKIKDGLMTIIQVFTRRGKSSDLNIVKNVWSMLVEHVYGQGNLYESVKEL